MVDMNPMKQKILAIDDDESIIALIQNSLHQQYQLIMANNGQVGIELTKEHNPDLILLDVEMPTMDGFQTLKLIRQDNTMKQIKVVMLTATSDENSIKKILELGVTDYIIKPLPPIKKFQSRIKNILEKKVILIIDDDTEILNLLKKTILNIGYKVLIVDSCVKGITILQNEPVSLTLLNQQMSDTDGMEALKKINKLPVSPPVIMMTTVNTSTTFEKVIDAFHSGASGLVKKPLDLKVIENEIKRVLKSGKDKEIIRSAEIVVKKLEAVRQTANTIKHEANSALTSLLGAQAILSRELSDNKYLNIIKEQTNRVSDLIKNLNEITEIHETDYTDRSNLINVKAFGEK